jgi:hypothetical protein
MDRVGLFEPATSATHQQLYLGSAAFTSLSKWYSNGKKRSAQILLEVKRKRTKERFVLLHAVW